MLNKGHSPVWYKLVSRSIFEEELLIAVQGLRLNNAAQKYLEHSVRGSDMVARLGGQEFSLYLDSDE